MGGLNEEVDSRGLSWSGLSSLSSLSRNKLFRIVSAILTKRKIGGYFATNKMYDVSLLDPVEDHIVWCISGDAFLERCEYHSGGDFRVTPWNMTPPHGPYIRMAERLMTVLISLSGDVLGNYRVTNEEQFYDASNQPITTNDINDTNDWSFLDASFVATLRWDANGQSAMNVRMDEGAMVRVEKTRNDAACDNIQIVCDASARSIDAMHLSTSSPDVLTASFDYATKFNANGGIVPISTLTHTLVVNDESFTEYILDNSGGEVIEDVSGLRSVVSALIAEKEFVGFSLNTVNVVCKASLSLETTVSFEVPLQSYFLFF